MKLIVALALASCLWACATEKGFVVNGPPPPPPITPPEATDVEFPDLTIEAGQAVIVPDVKVLFTGPIQYAYTYTAASSDTTVAGVELSDAQRLTIDGFMPGTADVTVTAREPDGPPGSFGPSGRSASRAATVIVTGG